MVPWLGARPWVIPTRDRDHNSPKTKEHVHKTKPLKSTPRGQLIRTHLKAALRALVQPAEKVGLTNHEMWRSGSAANGRWHARGHRKAHRHLQPGAAQRAAQRTPPQQLYTPPRLSPLAQAAFSGPSEASGASMRRIPALAHLRMTMGPGAPRTTMSFGTDEGLARHTPGATRSTCDKARATPPRKQNISVSYQAHPWRSS